ncbi:SDR family oxidoreductase [Nocardia sp. NPDC006044]|uniref:SDR family oxidoreductase n=1 Tax=Nocardia sp. NPDC006044 TaxID=3364306 RepID=UPI0036CDEC66
MGSLMSRRVVITGGAQGLGLEIARSCVQRGASVILLDIDAVALRHARRELGEQQCATFVCDIADREQIAATLTMIAAGNSGGISALVNNAGVFTNDAIEAADPGRASLAIAVNVNGTINITDAVLKQGLLCRETGQIVFINSSAGDPLHTGTGARERVYAATKGALTGYSKAIEGVAKGTPLRVTTIFPGGMDTNLYVNAGMSAEDGHNKPWLIPPRRVADAVTFVLELPVDTTISRLAIGPNL